MRKLENRRRRNYRSDTIMETRGGLIKQCKDSCQKRDIQGVVSALASLYGLWDKEGRK